MSKNKIISFVLADGDYHYLHNSEGEEFETLEEARKEFSKDANEIEFNENDIIILKETREEV